MHFRFSSATWNAATRCSARPLTTKTSARLHFFAWILHKTGDGIKHVFTRGNSKGDYKTHQLRTTFRSCDVEKVHPLWHEAHLEVKSAKNWRVRSTFGRSDVLVRGRRKGLCTFSKVSKTWGFCSISKNHGRRGTFEEDLQRCISRGRRCTKDMFIRDVRRSGRWFPEKGCILEHQICRFAKMILRGRCSASYDLASFFCGRRSTLERWSGKIAKRIGTRPSALHSAFDFWRKSRRIVSFLMLSIPKIEEVSQTCFVFDVVKFKNWGSLADLFRFWCCQAQTLRKSRRIASFSSLQKDRQTDRQIDR